MPAVFGRQVICAVCLGLLGSGSSAPLQDPLLLSATTVPIRIGFDSPFADLKARLTAKLADCGRTMPIRSVEADPPGLWGAATAASIRAVLACPGFESIPAASAAHQGALTSALWRWLMDGTDEPSLEARIETFVLSFEATDFADRPEWNFCQDSSADDLVEARSGHAPIRCYNASDPCSMLTWGPRGATAGQGREIQFILWQLARSAPALLRSAFGGETANVLRFVRLAGPPANRCDGTSPLEHFMCAVWISPQRRHAWEDGLLAIGRAAEGRRAYRELYAADEFDGYKLKAYIGLWRDADLEPSEIDLAFFYDRATHIGGPADGITGHRLRACMREHKNALTANAAARRCMAKLQPHPTQPIDRLGRDVAFYIDGFPHEALSAAERETWQHHIPLTAALNFGLSDARPAPRETANPSITLADPPPQDLSELTPLERACPAEIRAPVRSPHSN
jgi:hypothetical protein